MKKFVCLLLAGQFLFTPFVRAAKLGPESRPARAGQEGKPRPTQRGLMDLLRAGQLILRKEWLKGRWRHYTTADGLSSNVVLSMALEGDRAWFGTYAGGASCLAKTSGEWSVFTTKGGKAQARKTRSSLHWENVLEDNHVTAMAVDLDHTVWFGTTFYGYGDVFGVSRFSGTPAPHWTLYGQAQGLTGNDITSIACEPEYVWVGTTKGLGRFRRRDAFWSFFGSSKQIPGTYVNAVLVHGQEVWLGTSSGITVFDKQKATWSSFTTKDGLPEDSLQALADDGANIWAGGTYGSLAVFSTKEGLWKTVNSGDGLQDKWIKGLAADGKFLWVARDGGVSCLNVALGQWLSLTVDDGLIDGRVNAVAVDGASVWFGTGAGISLLYLNPERKP